MLTLDDVRNQDVAVGAVYGMPQSESLLGGSNVETAPKRSAKIQKRNIVKIQKKHIKKG